MKNLTFVAGLAALLGLMAWSLLVGAGPMSWSGIWHDEDMRDIFLLSRVPRTLALLLAGSAMSVVQRLAVRKKGTQSLFPTTHLFPAIAFR